MQPPVVPVYEAQPQQQAPANLQNPPTAPQVTTLLVTEATTNGTAASLGVIGGELHQSSVRTGRGDLI